MFCVVLEDIFPEEFWKSQDIFIAKEVKWIFHGNDKLWLFFFFLFFCNIFQFKSFSYGFKIIFMAWVSTLSSLIYWSIKRGILSLELFTVVKFSFNNFLCVVSTITKISFQINANQYFVFGKSGKCKNGIKAEPGHIFTGDFIFRPR